MAELLWINNMFCYDALVRPKNEQRINPRTPIAVVLNVSFSSNATLLRTINATVLLSIRESGVLPNILKYTIKAFQKHPYATSQKERSPWCSKQRAFRSPLSGRTTVSCRYRFSIGKHSTLHVKWKAGRIPQSKDINHCVLPSLKNCTKT